MGIIARMREIPVVGPGESVPLTGKATYVVGVTLTVDCEVAQGDEHHLFWQHIISSFDDRSVWLEGTMVTVGPLQRLTWNHLAEEEG